MSLQEGARKRTYAQDSDDSDDSLMAYKTPGTKTSRHSRTANLSIPGEGSATNPRKRRRSTLNNDDLELDETFVEGHDKEDGEDATFVIPVQESDESDEVVAVGKMRKRTSHDSDEALVRVLLYLVSLFRGLRLTTSSPYAITQDSEAAEDSALKKQGSKQGERGIAPPRVGLQSVVVGTISTTI